MLHIVKSSPACNGNGALNGRGIINAWNAASDWGRAEAFRVIGVADVWDVLADVVG